MFETEIEPIHSETASLDIRNWGVKITYRGKNRMKITFKLSQDEAAAFTSFQNATKPEGLSEDHFIKSIFFLGLTNLEQNITQKLSEKVKVEDGEITFDVPEDPEEVSAVENE